MNKQEFINTVAEKAQMSKAAASRAVDAIFDTASGAISDAVKTAGRLSLPGFGKFTTKKRAARKGRNPRTGAAIDIPERTVITFTPGQGLKETLGEQGGGRRRQTSARKSQSGGKTAGASTAKSQSSATKTRSTTAKSQSSGSKTRSSGSKSQASGARSRSSGTTK